MIWGGFQNCPSKEPAYFLAAWCAARTAGEEIVAKTSLKSFSNIDIT